MSAERRRLRIAPQLADYEGDKLGRVLWPLVMRTAKPGFVSPAMTVDSRGHRISRLDGEETRSDAAPEGAAFLLGGSYALGVGATSDAGTLAASLWRRTGVPYVNLGIGAASSIQELVTVIPFAGRTTTFVVCSGVNNFWLSQGLPGLDPMFGPMFHDSRYRKLAGIPIRTLVAAADGAGRFGERELAAELRRRLVKRARKRFRRRRAATPPARSERRQGVIDEAESVATAARLQLRDLRSLRRIVPAEASVVFALQPTAFGVEKEPSPEERELFAVLDKIQGRRWQERRRLFETQWGAFAAAIERGCAELGVRFVDLARGRYEGWCWVDRVHMTDRGYDAAAEMLETLIPHAPSRLA